MTHTANTTTEDRLRARLAEYPLDALLDALLTVDRLPRGSEGRVSRRWMIEEVERRCPAASDAVEAAYLASELRAEETGKPAEPVDYVAVLVAAVPRS